MEVETISDMEISWSHQSENRMKWALNHYNSLQANHTRQLPLNYHMLDKRNYLYMQLQADVMNPVHLCKC